ncbi:histidine kinase [Nesterenkonia halophila]|uniref:sensor histidine kinase n=1 Tax=Nesterenkonia halophila TaxID=302044 RepID=UPI0012927282|nr:histidine kinase [Nesterenkonia halophila]
MGTGRRLRPKAPNVVDALLGLLVVVAVAVMITADQAGERPPEVTAYLWALGLGALMLLRRTRPLVVLWLTVLGIFAYYAAGYPVIGLSVPAFAALFSAAERRGPRSPALAAVVLLVVSYAVRLLQGQDPARILGYEAVGHVALMAAAVTLGDALRIRRKLERSSQELLEATVAAERSRARQAVAEERSSIARELHDSLGHQLTVIAMHAEIAREAEEAAGSGPSRVVDQPHAALEVIGKTSRSMLEELRTTVRQLRRAGPEGRTDGGGTMTILSRSGVHEEDAGLPDVDESRASRMPPTVAGLRETVIPQLPLTVELDVFLDTELPSAVESAVHRIVQEALTNVVRHSRAGSAQVGIAADAEGLHVAISDGGPARLPQDSARSAGTGVAGMRERAQSLGGRLEAGPTEDGSGSGWRVDAWIPSDGQEER